MIRGIIATVLTAAALTACSGSPAEPDPTPTTPPPPRVYTDAELAAAMPTKENLDVANVVTKQCPEDPDTCQEVEGAASQVTVKIDLKPASGGSETDAEADRATSSRLGDTLYLYVYRFDTEAAFDAYQSKRQETDSEYVGDFSTEPVEQDESFTYGLRGTGTSEPLETGRFEGTVLSRRFELIAPGGDVDDELADAQIDLSAGLVAVVVSSAVDPDVRQAADAASTATQVATEYVERLEATEPAG